MQLRTGHVGLTDFIGLNPRLHYEIPGVTASVIAWPRAVAQRLDAGFPPQRPGFASGQSCGAYGGQSGTGAGFLRVLRFPRPIIPPISPLS
jgi:hypothetical protein